MSIAQFEDARRQCIVAAKKIEEPAVNIVLNQCFLNRAKIETSEPDTARCALILNFLI